jgi:hypothetical protein
MGCGGRAVRDSVLDSLGLGLGLGRFLFAIEVVAIVL